MDDSSEGRLWSLIRRFFSGKTESPIEDVIMEAQEDGELTSDESQMLINILRLGRKQVKEIMLPRTDIDCAETNASIQEVAEIIINTGHSRVPIFQQTKDHIVGIVHAKDLLTSLLHPESNGRSLRSIMRPPFFIPETINVKKMILEFQNKKVHMAIVIDEYGGTSGLITFEDVLEEIVGEIEDEYDAPRPAEIQILEDHSHLVSGRTTLTDLQEQLGIELESDQVETVGGYLTQSAGQVPQAGEVFHLQEYAFKIKEADAKQIFWILIYPLAETFEESATVQEFSK